MSKEQVKVEVKIHVWPQIKLLCVKYVVFIYYNLDLKPE